MLTFTFKNFLWNFLKKLANLNLSIFILFVISLFCLLGSLIEQDQTLLYYQANYPISDRTILTFNWKLIYYLGLDHIFQTWWFILIIIIFILTLLSCTFFTQLPSLKNARRWKFIYNKNYRNPDLPFTNNYSLNNNSLLAMIYSLVYSGFFVFGQNYSVYSHRGLYGRISPIVVHFSIVTILVGSMFSLLSGFVAQEIVPNGELFHIRNIVHSGILSRFPTDIFCRIDNFDIQYNFDGSIKQFFSKLSFISTKNKLLLSKKIAVNKPLNYRNLIFYQTNWEVNVLKIRLNHNNVIQKNLFKTTINNKNCWLCGVFLDDYKQVFFAVFDLNNPIVLFSSDGSIIGKIFMNQPFYLNNLFIVIDDILASTGLQIKMDFGIPVVYLGFLTLMLSTLLSYLSYSQIWFYRCSNLFQFLASTNRAILSFEENIFNINQIYLSLLIYLPMNSTSLRSYILE